MARLLLLLFVFLTSNYLVQPAGLLELLLQTRQLRQFHVQAAAQVQECLQLGGVRHLIRQRHLGALVEVLYVLQQLLSQEKEERCGGKRVTAMLVNSEVFLADGIPRCGGLALTCRAWLMTQGSR